MTDTNQSSAEASASVSTITIQGETFDVPAPYAEGHTLTANEAASLNQTRAENVRNNAASKIKKAKDAFVEAQVKAGASQADAEAAFTVSAELRAEIDAYARDYEFGARTARTTEPVDPLEREVRRVATEQLNEALKAKKMKKADLADGQYDQLVDALAADPDVQKEGKRRLGAKSKLGESLLNFAPAPTEQPSA